MAKLSIFAFIKSQWAAVRPVDPVDLSGQTIIITGANTGLGFEAAQHLARMSPGRLIMACRNLEKGKEALNRLQVNTGCKTAELWQLDLGSFASVLEFVDKFQKDGGRLDVLLCNAGIATETYQVSGDGWESTVQVNHLSTALLSLLLLPCLVETGKKYNTTPRLEIVSSALHYWAKLDKKATASNKGILATISSKEYCTPKIMGKRYPDSKLLNVFFTRSLASRVPPKTPVTVLTVHPGYCVSDLEREAAVISVRLRQGLLARSTADGAWQLAFGAIGGKDREDSLQGAYLSDMQVTEVSDYVLKETKIQDRLWEETLEILNKVSPQVQRVVEKYLS